MNSFFASSEVDVTGIFPPAFEAAGEAAGAGVFATLLVVAHPVSVAALAKTRAARSKSVEPLRGIEGTSFVCVERNRKFGKPFVSRSNREMVDRLLVLGEPILKPGVGQDLYQCFYKFT